MLMLEMEKYRRADTEKKRKGEQILPLALHLIRNTLANVLGHWFSGCNHFAVCLCVF